MGSEPIAMENWLHFHRLDCRVFSAQVPLCTTVPVALRICYFSRCYDQNWKNQLKQERIDFGSWLVGQDLWPWGGRGSRSSSRLRLVELAHLCLDQDSEETAIWHRLHLKAKLQQLNPSRQTPLQNSSLGQCHDLGITCSDAWAWGDSSAKL